MSYNEKLFYGFKCKGAVGVIFSSVPDAGPSGGLQGQGGPRLSPARDGALTWLMSALTWLMSAFGSPPGNLEEMLNLAHQTEQGDPDADRLLGVLKKLKSFGEQNLLSTGQRGTLLEEMVGLVQKLVQKLGQSGHSTCQFISAWNVVLDLWDRVYDELSIEQQGILLESVIRLTRLSKQFNLDASKRAGFLSASLSIERKVPSSQQEGFLVEMVDLVQQCKVVLV